MKVICPFCKPKTNALRGDGCCFCDYEGMIPEKENRRLLDPGASNTDEYPFWSNYDLKAGRDILRERQITEQDRMFATLTEYMPEEELSEEATARIWKGIEAHLNS